MASISLSTPQSGLPYIGHGSFRRFQRRIVGAAGIMHFPDALAFAGAGKLLPQVRQNDIGPVLRYEIVALEPPTALAFRAREFDIGNVEFAQRK
jgi:hypothetical protein